MDEEVARLLANAADALRGLIAELMADVEHGGGLIDEKKVVKEIDDLLDEHGLAHAERVAEDGGVDFSDPEVDAAINPGVCAWCGHGWYCECDPADNPPREVEDDRPERGGPSTGYPEDEIPF